MVVYLDPPLVLDFSFVDCDDEAGAGAHQAAKAKSEKHSAACRSKGHSFSPFVGENAGHHDEEALKVVRDISRSLPGWKQRCFTQEVKAKKSAVRKQKGSTPGSL